MARKTKQNRRIHVRRRKAEAASVEHAGRITYVLPPEPVGIAWVCDDPSCIHQLRHVTEEAAPQNENEPRLATGARSATHPTLTSEGATDAHGTD